MKRSIIVVLSVAVVVLSILYARQIMQNKSFLNRESENLPEVKDSGVDADNMVVKTLKNELTDKDSEIKILREQLADLKEKNKSLQIMQVAKDSVKKDNKTIDVAGSSDVVSANLKDGEELSQKLSSLIDMQNANSSAPTLEDKYSVLFDKIEVSDSVKKKLMALLNKKSNLWLTGGAGEDVDKQISDLLGDKYDQYKKYEEELPTRLFVDDFASYLAENGHALTGTQVDEFMKLDPDTVKDIPLSYGAVQFKINPTGEEENLGDAASNALEDNIVNFDKVDAKAKGVLNDEQKELFDNYLGERFHAKENVADLMDQILPNLKLPNNGKSTISVSATTELSLPSE